MANAATNILPEIPVDGTKPEPSSTAPASHTLGRKLAVLAKLKGLTQEQIAKECAISRISVNRFFRSHTEIRAGDLTALLKILGIELNDIIDQTIKNEMSSK
jgi:transcriptional regulator with XRE-family HTH domain